MQCLQGGDNCLILQLPTDKYSNELFSKSVYGLGQLNPSQMPTSEKQN